MPRSAGLAATSEHRVPKAPRTDVEALIERLKNPDDRTAAREAIVALGAEATPTLLRHARDEDGTVRWEFANIAGTVRDARCVEPLVENVLIDADPHVRWRSLWALSTYQDRARTMELLRHALGERQGVPRWNAIVGLAFFQAPEVVPLVHQGLDDPDSWRRWEAINALRTVHDETSARALEGILTRGKDDERTEAVMALGNIGGPDAYALLVRALGDPQAQVRWRACMALGTIGDRNAREPIEALLLKETDATVIENARQALARLGGGT
jgi:HEAT repeat protein